jgi:glucose-6-phosphate 1-dehydrogenase
VKPEEEKCFDKFLSLNYYINGSYDEEEHFKQLNNKIVELSEMHSTPNLRRSDCNRIFYFALPPTVYDTVTQQLSLHCKAQEYIFGNEFYH